MFRQLTDINPPTEHCRYLLLFVSIAGGRWRG
jgi:hypothetical protein